MRYLEQSDSETERRMEVAQGPGRGSWGGHRVSVLPNGKSSAGGRW